MRFEIRKARREDVSRLQALNEQLGYAATEAVMAKRLEALLADEDHAVLVAEGSKGEVIGWVQGAVRRLLEEDLHIEMGGLVVEESWRSQGVGGELMAAIEVWAIEKGAQFIYLRSNIVRERAHDFYLRSGYEVEKTSKIFRKSLSEGAETA